MLFLDCDEKDSMSPKQHDFNWVDATYNASPENQFGLIGRDVERLVETRNKQLPEGSILKLKHKAGPREITVSHTHWRPGIDHEIIFFRTSDHISVRGDETGDIGLITMNPQEDGTCLFYFRKSEDDPVDTDDALLRWQVLKRVLRSFVFDR